jgi:hypothetical protein
MNIIVPVGERKVCPGVDIWGGVASIVLREL